MTTKAINPWPPFDWDEAWYLSRYPDIAVAVAEGRLSDPLYHYIQTGFREGRFASADAEEKAKQSPEGDSEPRRLRVMAFEAWEVAEQVQLGDFSVPLDWPVKGEIGKTFIAKLAGDFFHKYMRGATILDVGYKGGHAEAVPIFPHAIGVDLDYPGYDGVRLPFDDGSVDTVFASHVLEHVPAARAALRDWFRVIKVGGFIVCIVPHQYLYERKVDELPSNWNGEHLRFYTPATLLQEIENSLDPNTYRIRHLLDNDLGYHYALSPDHHPFGCYEIELVIEKIMPPPWNLC